MSHGVRLEALVEAHAGVLYPILVDPEIRQFIDDEPPASREALAALYRRLETRRSPSGRETWLNWAIVVDEAYVGFVQATITGTRAEIAYVVGTAFSGRGIATRATTAMLQLLRAEYAVARFTATVDARNLPSVSLLERLGFTVVDESDARNLRFERRDA